MGDRRGADVALVVARLGGGAGELWICPHVPISSQPTCRPAGLSVGSSPCQRRNVRCGHATFVWSCGPKRLLEARSKRHLMRGWGTSSPGDHPAVYPAAASPAPAATDPCSSSPSDAGHPRKAGARTWTSPGAPAAQAHQPARKPLVQRGQPLNLPGQLSDLILWAMIALVTRRLAATAH